jgi:hypothetical protein
MLFLDVYDFLIEKWQFIYSSIWWAPKAREHSTPSGIHPRPWRCCLQRCFFDATKNGRASHIIGLTEKSNIAVILIQCTTQFATTGLIKLPTIRGGNGGKDWPRCSTIPSALENMHARLTVRNRLSVLRLFVIFAKYPVARARPDILYRNVLTLAHFTLWCSRLDWTLDHIVTEHSGKRA